MLNNNSIEKPTKKIINNNDNFYNQFKPIDEILLKPLVKCSHIIMKNFYYKSEIIGFMTLLCFLIATYFSYNKKDNLTYIFIFFAFFISFFDNLYDNKLNEKQKDKEMLIVLIKLTLHIIVNMIIKLYAFKDYSCSVIKKNLYMLVFFLIIVLMLSHHTEKIFKKKKIVSKKLSYITKINVFLLFITCFFIFLFSFQFIIDDNKDALSVFIQNDKNALSALFLNNKEKEEDD